MNKLKRPVFLLLTAGLLCATGTAAYFSDFEKKINSAAVGYVTTEIEEDFPDPTPTPMENGSILQKRDPDRKFFRQCERVPGRLLCEDVPFLLQ